MNIGNYESAIKHNNSRFNELRQNTKELIKLRNSLRCTDLEKIKEINIKIKKNNQEIKNVNSVIEFFKKRDLENKLRVIKTVYHISIISFLIALCGLILFS